MPLIIQELYDLPYWCQWKSEVMIYSRDTAGEVMMLVFYCMQGPVLGTFYRLTYFICMVNLKRLKSTGSHFIDEN